MYESGWLEIHIAKFIGVSTTTIHRRLINANVKFRSHSESCFKANKIVVNLQDIRSKYEIEKMSVSEISSKLGVSRGAVSRRLKNAGVVLRGPLEAHDLVCHSTFAASEPCIEFLDGLLLGDAWLECDNIGEGRLGISQRQDRIAWLEQIKTELAKHDIVSSIKPRPARPSYIGNKIVAGKASEQLRTLKYVQFTEQRSRWYPNGTKIVPKDIKLTPISIAQWYWGDGGLLDNGRSIYFCTDSFSMNDVEFLRKKLYDIYGWNARVFKHKGYPRLAISHYKDRMSFIDCVRGWCPPCFDYKLKLYNRHEFKIFTVEQELRDLRSQRITYAEISRHFNMSKGWSWWACHRLGI